jgi:2-phospho-L-lactate guanylyltransferase
MALVLIPVKSLAKAKSRLRSVLQPSERRALVLAMLRKVMGECLSCPRIEGVCLVTPDREIVNFAQALCAKVVLEAADEGLNSAVVAGLRGAVDLPVDHILILPADIPLLGQSDLDQILDATSDPHQSVLVPCYKGDGTNAILIPAASPFAPQFGKNSFSRHKKQLIELGLVPKVLNLPRVAADIDEPDDLTVEVAALIDAAPAVPMRRGMTFPDGSE